MGWRTRHTSSPGDPGYIDTETFLRAELARRAEYDARLDVVAKRLADAEAVKRVAAKKNARRKHPGVIQSTDYPWLKPDWIEAPVRPFKRS